MTHKFRVWAPRPQRVEVVLGEQRIPMGRDAGGWWACSVDEAGPGTDYALSLDGGAPRPDPRSAFQPQGVDGPSRVVDHSAFAWRDSGWGGGPLPGIGTCECDVGAI